MHFSQVPKDNGVTDNASPPKVTKTNCRTRIDAITATKVQFRVIPAKGLNWAVRMVKPLKVMAIIKTANSAEWISASL